MIRQFKFFVSILLCIILILNNPLMGLATVIGFLMGYLTFTEEIEDLILKK